MSNNPSVMRFFTTSVLVWRNRSVKLPVLLWFVLAISAVLAEWLRHSINNYYIFKGVFWHTVAQTNLYIHYPSEHFDLNHYGPFFSVVIFPFALLPDWAGVFAWCLLNSFVLFYAINKLPFRPLTRHSILLIVAIEMMTSVHSVQINPMIAGWLILAYVLTERGNNFWATFFIAAGFMTKIYGIAGLLFFIFSNDKPKFLISFLFWLVMMFLLPMLFSSPQFILNSYLDWFGALSEKNTANINFADPSLMQDISLLGFLRRSFGFPSIYNAVVILGGVAASLLPLLRSSQFRSQRFRLSYLAIILLSAVIFSTSAESPTYVIAVSGVAIWYTIAPKNRWTTLLLLLTMIITCLSGTDLFPGYIRDHFISPYSLKALPCILIWFVLIISVAFKKFHTIKNTLPAHETRIHYIPGLQ